MLLVLVLVLARGFRLSCLKVDKGRQLTVKSLHPDQFHLRPVRLASKVRPPKLLVPGFARTPSTTFLCSAGVAHPGEEANKGHFNGQFDPNLSVPNVVAAKGGGGQNFGSGGSLGAVMERSRLEFVMPTPPAVAPKLDDGGSGGDIGKNIHNGGGGGDGDGGDDDDYFNEDGDGDGEGDGEGGDAFFRTLIPESYDKLSIGAVFAEWMRTVAELPLILRRAVEMGLFSSAQLVRFFAMDVRPNLTRTVSRSLPPAWARDFVGRLMADPAFVQKMVIESVIAACSSLYYEYRVRGDKFKDELDMVLINTIGMAAATSATVWMVAPTRSYGTVHKFPWQQSRVAAFFSKAAELSAVGLLTGAGTSLLSSAAVALRQKYVDPNFEPSVPVPDVARSSAGLAAFFALSANTRYQLVGGMDRYLLGHSNFLWTYLAMSGAARVVSNQIGETHRSLCQGLPNPSAHPRRRVVKKKVVRRKVVKPAAAPVPEPAATAVAVQPAVESQAADLPSTSGQMAAATTSLLQAERTGNADMELVLDQVLAVAGPSSGERLGQAMVEVHAATPSGDMAHHEGVAGHAGSVLSTSPSPTTTSASQQNADSAIDFNALMALQSSATLEQLSAQQQLQDRVLAAAAAGAGQLLAAGQR
ncbi:hypothetical protein VOLCADRAFT_106890 [Volvox carteri f. nagariensis]|uniref:Uncharacterized protein n=1 Tax=Volvox carteri f. nagariensis TaxID=3068 RepID=D8UAG1_VOLCA|nr:uncharacterized protein VOLCADRAFT_106890 [Volvox carteri f. nagariensis]EFJ43257.1 hypothetical protein VOLCADRAFT_106890 [Volvox carteri f. nagariensis]|eukprot:XP_002955617.1 hypothetical protein VOLCADRAFT_106890 [Volvox carteri f. nagariensis]